MSKSLEKEYREFTAKDVPDLWERIEGGLESKRPVAVKKSWQGRYRIWGMAAACLCLAVTGFGLRTLLLPDFEAMSGEKSGMAENGGTYDLLTPADDGMYYEAADGAADREMMGVEVNSMYEAPREDAGALGGGMAGEEFFQAYALQVRILEVSQEEGRPVYTVEIEKSEEPSLQEGDRIALHDGRSEGETPEVGATCRIDISITTDADGGKIYWIERVK